MWDDARQLNAVAFLLFLVALALFAWAAVAWSVRQPAFAFGQVRIDGALARANRAHIEAVIREELKGTFFTMRLDDARARLERVPWVRRVALRRQWPNRLEIAVSEHEPLARWNDNALVNSDGEVFNADYNGELPQFAGPEGTAGEMTARFREFGGVLGSLGVAIGAIRLSPRGGWQLQTTGAQALTVELGRSEPRDRLARFAAYYPKTVGALARAGTRIEHVDLRYRNGFAARVPGFNERTAKKVR